jgi:hypothetical protein
LRAASLAFASAFLLLASACALANPFAPASIAAPPSVDTVCVSGTRFTHDYAAVAARYDPRYETDRQQLAATHSLATARGLLGNLAVVLDGYDGALLALTAPADFSGAVAAVVSANRQLRDGALQLANSPFGTADQSAFQERVTARHAALHDLQLQVAFVGSECG